jgi:dTDP-4-dehydrorhamnose 3,5-epimerase-like enzyme
MFKNGKIHDVVVKDLVKHIDDRGWLTEIFREDEMEKQFLPVMAYISMTKPNVARGPHEHADQADDFGFLGPSNFKIYLWDNRKSSPTYMRRRRPEIHSHPRRCRTRLQECGRNTRDGGELSKPSLCREGEKRGGG